MHPYAIHLLCLNPRILGAEAKLKLLMNNGAVPFVNTHDSNGFAPLHYLLQNLSRESDHVIPLLKILCENGADADSLNAYSMPAMFYFLDQVYIFCPFQNEALAMLLKCTDPNKTYEGGYEIVDYCREKQDYIVMSDRFKEARRLCSEAKESYPSNGMLEYEYPDYGMALRPMPTEMDRKLTEQFFADNDTSEAFDSDNRRIKHL